MTFLNPFLLFGLAAAAIPVILHLLNLRKLKTIDFSTLTFLRELQQSRIRRLKLRQILLLIVRTLMVVFIVLAFARPAMKGSLPAGFGGNASSSVAIVIDDSYSMMAADGAGERYAQARSAAGSIISLLKDGDAAWLVRLSDLPAVTVDPPTHDFRTLRELIDRSRPSYVRRPLGDGVAAALRLMEESKGVNREMYLVGDFQATSLEGGGNGTVPAVGSTTGFPAGSPGAGAKVDPRVRLFLVDIGEKDLPNTAVDSVAVVSRIFEKNRPVEISAQVRNYGPDALKDAVVSLFDGATRVAQTNVTIAAGGTATAALTYVPRKSGIVGGSVGLEADQLDPDNRGFFTFTVPERIRVLVARGSESDVKFLIPALRAGSAGEGESSMEITQVPAAGLGRASVRDYDVVVLCGVPSFDQSTADRIRNFVDAGGGLVLFPGDELDPANYNQRLLGPMNLPAIRGIEGGDGAETGLYYREIDFDHPLFATIFEKDARTSDVRRLSPRIAKSVQLRPTPRSRSVITLSNGAGFFIEQAVGSGRAALFSCAPLLSWSEFPMKGLFAPLVYRTVVYLASGPGRSGQYAVGSGAEITLRAAGGGGTGAGNAETRYSLRLPDGVEEFIVPVPSGSGLQFNYPLLTLPGHYRLTAGDTVLAILPANLPAREADLAKADPEAVDRFLADRGFDESQVRRLPPGDGLPARITEARYGMELWKYCVGLVLLLALVEMAVNRHAGGEKTADA
jgi:hypothetical protein